MPNHQLNGGLLLFDFDNTIIKGHLHAHLIKLNVQNRTEEQTLNIVDEYIKNKTTGIQNKETLKKIIENALDKKIDVQITSFTLFEEQVQYVKNHYLGLKKENYDKINVVGKFPEHYLDLKDFTQNEKKINGTEQGKLVGKTFHLIENIKHYQNNHNGNLPKNIALVDDSEVNIKKLKDFYKIISSTPEIAEWVKKQLNIQDISLLADIQITGILVDKKIAKTGNIDYIEEANKFINSSDKTQFNSLSELTPKSSISEKIDITEQLKEVKNKQLPGIDNNTEALINHVDQYLGHNYPNIKLQAHDTGEKQTIDLISTEPRTDFKNIVESVKKAIDQFISQLKKLFDHSPKKLPSDYKLGSDGNLKDLSTPINENIYAIPAQVNNTSKLNKESKTSKSNNFTDEEKDIIKYTYKNLLRQSIEFTKDELKTQIREKINKEPDKIVQSAVVIEIIEKLYIKNQKK